MSGNDQGLKVLDIVQVWESVKTTRGWKENPVGCVQMLHKKDVWVLLEDDTLWIGPNNGKVTKYQDENYRYSDYDLDDDEYDP